MRSDHKKILNELNSVINRGCWQLFLFHWRWRGKMDTIWNVEVCTGLLWLLIIHWLCFSSLCFWTWADILLCFCHSGYSGLRLRPEGPGAAQAEALWEEEEPGRLPHPGKTCSVLRFSGTQYRCWPAGTAAVFPSLWGHVHSEVTHLPDSVLMSKSSNFVHLEFNLWNAD